jgi:hypothetical protein
VPVWALWATTFPRAAFNLCGIGNGSHEFPDYVWPTNEEPSSGSAAEHNDEEITVSAQTAVEPSANMV